MNLLTVSCIVVIATALLELFLTVETNTSVVSLLVKYVVL